MITYPTNPKMPMKLMVLQLPYICMLLHVIFISSLCDIPIHITPSDGDGEYSGPEKGRASGDLLAGVLSSGGRRPCGGTAAA